MLCEAAHALYASLEHAAGCSSRAVCCFGGIILPIENAFPRCSFAEIVFPFFGYFSTIVGFRIWGAGFPISSLACTNQQKPPRSSQHTAQHTAPAEHTPDWTLRSRKPTPRTGRASAHFGDSPQPAQRSLLSRAHRTLGRAEGLKGFRRRDEANPRKFFF